MEGKKTNVSNIPDLFFYESTDREIDLATEFFNSLDKDKMVRLRSYLLESKT